MKLQNVTVHYGNKIALRDISLSFQKGEFAFLIGGSGSGKTTLIKTLIGEIRPSSGILETFDKKNLSLFSTKDLAVWRRRIGTIFQDYKLLPGKTVRENVAFAMEVCGYSDKDIAVRLPEILAEVGILAKKESMVEMLSGWEAQRVAIARALIHDPELIIADEPTGNLDPVLALDIMRLLERLAQKGKTVIIATHDEKLVNTLKKRVIALEDGRIVSDEQNASYTFVKQ